jgi:hypothetical protein
MVPTRLMHNGATISVNSPPPCGEGLGVGVAQLFAGGAIRHLHCITPSPPLPQRKSGLPDLRSLMRNPGKPGFRGGGSRPNSRQD